jgi:large subunit ribosomal protein L17
MRHLKSGYHLNRTKSHRKALLSNLSAALFERKRITTTLAKAKATRSVAERFITFAKKGDLASRRHVLRFIPRKHIVKMLFEEIAPAYADRPGGYSRIVKLGQRMGDGAPLAILELVGFEEVVAAKKAAAAKKKAEKEAKKEAKEKKEEKEKEQPETAKPKKKAKTRTKPEEAAVEEAQEAVIEEEPQEVPAKEEKPKKRDKKPKPSKTKEK